MDRREEMISRLADDLELVKSAVSRSSTVLREVAGPSRYRGLLWYIGGATIVLGLLFHFVPAAYGGFASTPAWVQVVLFVGAIAVALSAALVKLVTVGRAARAVDPRLGVLSFFRQHYAPVIVHLYPPLILITAGVCAWLASTGRGAAVVGTLGLFSGLMLNLLGVNMRQHEYLVFGYWTMLGGAASLFVHSLSPALWVAIVFGGGCLVCAGAATAADRRR